jgi:excinuclease ABC subunit A
VVEHDTETIRNADYIIDLGPEAGNKGGKIKELSDISIIVDSSITSQTQEAHRVIYHIICKIVERQLSKK